MKNLVKLCCLMLGLALTYQVHSQGYRIDSMVVNINLNHEGEAEIHEQIYVDFNEARRGIIRNIPYAYNFDGKRYDAELTRISVDDEEQHISKKRGEVLIRIGNKDKYITGKKHYSIHYKVIGPFIKSESYEEFYWNITGNEWDTSIGKARFAIKLPDDVTIRYNDVRIFTGKSGANEKDADVFTTKNLIYGNTTKTLQKKEGLTAAVKLPLGFVQNDQIFHAKQSSAHTKDIPWWSLIFPASLLMGVLGWWRGLRGSKDGYDIVPISIPPKGLSPVMVGGFIDNKVHNRDVLSLIPFWANMGVLTMTRISKDDLIFEKIGELPPDRPQYEHEFFRKLFSNGKYTNLSEVNSSMYKTINDVKRDVYQEFQERALYDDRYSYWFKSWRIVVVGFIALLLAGFMMTIGHFFTGVVFILAGIIFFILRAVSAPPSEKGMALRAKLKGLEAHLKNGSDLEIEQLVKEDDQYYQRLFPFAMALGLESSWSDRVIKYDDVPPHWYYMGHGYQGVHTKSGFTEAFQTKSIESAFIQYPQSSSSGAGGFSGGSSGGGFGGGGGSSW